MSKINQKIEADLKNKLGDKWELFKKIHKLILSLNKEVDFRVFPIYIRYSLREKNIALIYFKGKFVANGNLDFGLNLEKYSKVKGFVRAKHMKYPGITHSVKLKKLEGITSDIIKAIKSII